MCENVYGWEDGVCVICMELLNLRCVCAHKNTNLGFYSSGAKYVSHRPFSTEMNVIMGKREVLISMKKRVKRRLILISNQGMCGRGSVARNAQSKPQGIYGGSTKCGLTSLTHPPGSFLL